MKQRRGENGIGSARFKRVGEMLKTPHMGWSLVEAVKDSPFGPVGHSDYFYFVHSYAAESIESPAVVATTDYGVSYPSVVIDGHLWGCQFHPEKSSTAGIGFLSTFVNYVKTRVPAAVEVGVH